MTVDNNLLYLMPASCPVSAFSPPYPVFKVQFCTFCKRNRSLLDLFTYEHKFRCPHKCVSVGGSECYRPVNRSQRSKLNGQEVNARWCQCRGSAAGASAGDLEGKERQKAASEGWDKKTGPNHYKKLNVGRRSQNTAKANRKMWFYLYTCICVCVVCAQSGLTLRLPLTLPIKQPYYL